MQRDRSWRRAQRERVIANVRNWMRSRHFYTGGTASNEEADEQCARWARYRHSARADCSGYCCGNPRKWFGELTMAERRADDAAMEDFE